MKREARTKSGRTITVGVGEDASRGGGHPLKRQRGRERGENNRRGMEREAGVKRWRKWRDSQEEERGRIVWGRGARH
jgi:hypothetical protein